jgi:hypothetical protein
MARRMTLEGAKVKAVCEVMPYSGGLPRNIEQCLNDFKIPLKLSHTVVEIHGKDRLEGVTIAKVDENRKPIEKSKKFIKCDTLLLSVGLIPENELTKKADVDLSTVTSGATVDQDRQTMISGIFACGNVLHVHDLVDYVSEEAEIAGKAASEYIKKNVQPQINLKIIPDGKIRYTVPQIATLIKDFSIYFRVSDIFENCEVVLKDEEKEIIKLKKQKLVPGQMEKIDIKKEMIKEISGNNLYIELNQK